MERVIRGRSFTLTKTFYVDGVATDPTGTPTVTITRDDGTLVTAGSVVDETEAGTWSVTVPASENVLLDTLRVVWSAVAGGETQEYVDTVEVAGDVLFTVAQALATDGLSGKTPAQIIEKRTLVEGLLEKACGVAFVPRYGKVLLSGNGRSTILLPPRVTAIRSVLVDDVAVTDASTIRLLASGEAYYPNWWTAGYANVVVAFEHGYSDGSERMAAGDAALSWAKMLLLKGPIDDRATGQVSEFGNITLATPGMRGSVSGIPSVDQFIQSYNLSVCVA
jgi:hypothetical protein